MNRITRALAPLLLLPPIVACASRQAPPRYVRAEPVKEEPIKPAIVQVPTPMPLPGQLKATHPVVHPADRAKGTRRAPSDVIREANRKATEGPAPDGFFNAVMNYDYMTGALYQVYTAPERLTDIQLEAGEHLLGKPAAGDAIRWILARGSSSTAGVEQQHVYIKPTRPDLDTTLCINTDRRTYLLELHSYDDTYMAAVAWRYPQEELSQLETALAQQQSLARSTVARASTSTS